MRPSNDLLVGGAHPTHKRLVFGIGNIGIASQCSDIVDSLEDDQVFHPSLRQNVMIKPRKGVGARAVVQQPVATDTVIEYCQLFLAVISSFNALCKNVRPAI